MNERIQRLLAAARMLSDRSPEGARQRKRAVALGAFTLFALGFLVAVDLGELIVLAGLALVPIAALTGLVVLVRRRRGAARRLGTAAKGLGSAGRAGAGIVQQAGRAGAGVVQHASRAGADVVQQAARASKRPSRPRPARRQRVPAAPTRAEARRLNADGMLSRRDGDFSQAVERHERALAILQELGDRPAEALTLNNLALALGHAGQDEAALDRFHDALTILRELEDDQHEAKVVANLGMFHGRKGRSEQALYCLETALEKLDPDSPDYRSVQEQLRRAS